MSEKQCRERSLRLVVASIISGSIAVIFLVGFWEFSEVLSLGSITFTVITIILGVVAIVKIFQNWKKKKISAIIQLFVLLFAGYALLGLSLGLISHYRIRNSIIFSGAAMMKNFGNLINEYTKENEFMPDSNHWCDSLIGYTLVGSMRVTTHSFDIVRDPDIECNFAFNKKLSNLSTNGLPGNVVILFEADGELNLSGGPELITAERAKDKYFSFKRQRYIYVLFVDGTIAKYRLHDSAVALYKPDADELTDWFQQSQTPYSPLRWE